MSSPLTVHLEDVLRATAAAYQGCFRVGTNTTMWLQGFYGVASADSGTLTLVITDQTGATSIQIVQGLAHVSSVRRDTFSSCTAVAYSQRYRHSGGI